MSNIGFIPITIESGQSLSSAVDLGDLTLVGILFPSSWTTAVVTFLVSGSMVGDFKSMYVAGGTELSTAAAANRYTALTDTNFLGVRYLKLRSGTSATPVNQAASREITLVVRR